MPIKAVNKITCDRCGDDWYEDQGTELPTTRIVLEYELPDAPLKDPKPGELIPVSSGGTLKFDTLCKGCTKTCRNLLKALGKTFQPRKPRAKKEETKAPNEPTGEDKTSPADSTTSVKPPADSPATAGRQADAATPRVTPPGASASGAAAASGGKAPPAAQSRPTQR